MRRQAPGCTWRILPLSSVATSVRHPRDTTKDDCRRHDARAPLASLGCVSNVLLLDAKGPERQTADQPGTVPSEAEALDAYSRVVTDVAGRVAASVANLRVMRRVRGGRRAAGGGSAVVLTPSTRRPSPRR